jgi:hypothetical protein
LFCFSSDVEFSGLQGIYDEPSVVPERFLNPQQSLQALDLGDLQWCFIIKSLGETSGDNLFNILQMPFLNKTVLCSFSQIRVWLCNVLAKEYWRKSC